MEIHRLNPTGFFNSHSLKSAQGLQSKMSQSDRNRRSLFESNQHPLNPISDPHIKEGALSPLWVKREGKPRLDLSHSHRLRKRTVNQIGLHQNIRGSIKTTVKILFKYHLINQTIHDGLLTHHQPYAQLHDLIMHQLLNQKSLIEFVIDQMKKKPGLTNDKLKKSSSPL